MTTPNDLSDKALADFAFAAYHQLDGGEPISSVVLKDGTGHEVDQSALTELVGQGLAEEADGRLHFVPAGQLLLSQILDRIRGSW